MNLVSPDRMQLSGVVDCALERDFARPKVKKKKKVLKLKSFESFSDFPQKLLRPASTRNLAEIEFRHHYIRDFINKLT